jgi:hypothetical protein
MYGAVHNSARLKGEKPAYSSRWKLKAEKFRGLAQTIAVPI